MDSKILPKRTPAGIFIPWISIIISVPIIIGMLFVIIYQNVSQTYQLVHKADRINTNNLSDIIPTKPIQLPTPSATPKEITEPTETSIIGNDWKAYFNETFGLSFQLPMDWKEPAVTMAENTINIEIGTNEVYPYGTSLEDRRYTDNSYVIIIIYYINRGQLTREHYMHGQMWALSFLRLCSL